MRTKLKWLVETFSWHICILKKRKSNFGLLSFPFIFIIITLSTAFCTKQNIFTHCLLNRDQKLFCPPTKSFKTFKGVSLRVKSPHLQLWLCTKVNYNRLCSKYLPQCIVDVKALCKTFWHIYLCSQSITIHQWGMSYQAKQLQLDKTFIEATKWLKIYLMKISLEWVGSRNNQKRLMTKF